MIKYRIEKVQHCHSSNPSEGKKWKVKTLKIGSQQLDMKPHKRHGTAGRGTVFPSPLPLGGILSPPPALGDILAKLSNVTRGTSGTSNQRDYLFVQEHALDKRGLQRKRRDHSTAKKIQLLLFYRTVRLEPSMVLFQSTIDAIEPEKCFPCRLTTMPYIWPTSQQLPTDPCCTHHDMRRSHVILDFAFWAHQWPRGYVY